jgi:cytochrome P450
VRIAPNELSIKAVDASAVIYGQGSKFRKAPYFYRAFETESSNLFTMTEREAHLKDKKLMSNAFSRASILNFEEVMASKVQILMVRLRQYVEANKPLPLMNAFRCLTLDTITEFCYGEPMGALHAENLDIPLFGSFDLATKAIIFVGYTLLPLRRTPV